MERNVVILITFCLYLSVMLGIGIYFYFKTKNLEDYILGGRKLGKWVTSISAQASDMSGWLLMGLRKRVSVRKKRPQWKVLLLRQSLQ